MALFWNAISAAEAGILAAPLKTPRKNCYANSLLSVSFGTEGFTLPLSTIRLWEACRKISEAFIFVAIAVVAVALSAMISGAGPFQGINT
jgi:hypothetical protein